jgi:hypothetical protein
LIGHQIEVAVEHTQAERAVYAFLNEEVLEDISNKSVTINIKEVVAGILKRGKTLEVVRRVRGDGCGHCKCSRRSAEQRGQ